MNREFVFRRADASDSSYNNIYVHLCSNGTLFWNIDIPFVAKWSYLNSYEPVVILKDKSDREVGRLDFFADSATAMTLGGRSYVQVMQPTKFWPDTARSFEDGWPRVDMSSIYSLPDWDILSGLNLDEEISICWFNRASPVLRKPASPFSRIFGKSSETTKKWEAIFNLRNGGLPSPDVFLLYLKDAYVLNGSIVFTRSGRLVGCTEQLGLTLGPWTNYCSKNPDDSDELRFLRNIIDDPNAACSRDSSIPVLDDSIHYFLYSTCHTGFGHHLGQSTVSSFFLNLFIERDPSLAHSLVSLYRGGLSYESFRSALYELSLDQSIKVQSHTNGLVRVPRLVIPSTLANYGNHWMNFGPLFKAIRDRARLRSSIAEIDIPLLYKGIYLSRRGYRRGCSNADAVSALLNKAGFLEYSPPGSFTLIDQIALMSHFRAVFSSYGSGANNILFSGDDSHLIQPLCSASDGQSWDYSSAQMVGADYTYIFFPPDVPTASFHERSYTYDLECIGDIIDKVL